MTDRENLYKGLSHAAWGYFFLNFDFNLGTVSIFPRFAGYLLFLSAIGKLAGERRDLLLLRPLCVLLAVWNGGDWLLSWGGGDIDGHVLFLDLLMAAAGLYRTAYIVLVTVISLFSAAPGQIMILGDDWRAGIILGLAVTACVFSLMIMVGLFELRKFFLPGAAEV